MPIETDGTQLTSETLATSNHGANALDLKPQVFKAGLDRRKKNRDALIEWVRDALKEDIDFGRISIKRKNKQTGEVKYVLAKPSLWKPGAEKICGMLGMTATYPRMDELQDLFMQGKTLNQIMLRCHIINAQGQVVSEGVGARSLAQDDNDLNKCLKMAQKSAHIDATLRLAGLSEIFTQDFEPGENGSGDVDDEATGEDGMQVGMDCCPIGKWRGAPWNMVDTDYLQWMVKTLTDKPDVVKAAAAELGKRTERQSTTAETIDQTEIVEVTGETIKEWADKIKACKTLDEFSVVAFDIPTPVREQIQSLLDDAENRLYLNNQDQQHES